MRDDSKVYVKDEKDNKVFSLYREKSSGKMIAEFKTKSRDPKRPTFVCIDAVEVIDKIAAELNFKERMLAYRKLLARIEEAE